VSVAVVGFGCCVPIVGCRPLVVGCQCRRSLSVGVVGSWLLGVDCRLSTTGCWLSMSTVANFFHSLLAGKQILSFSSLHSS
jgi:hypothetical protein